jgi:hypothetical protein
MHTTVQLVYRENKITQNIFSPINIIVLDSRFYYFFIGEILDLLFFRHPFTLIVTTRHRHPACRVSLAMFAETILGQASLLGMQLILACHCIQQTSLLCTQIEKSAAWFIYMTNFNLNVKINTTAIMKHFQILVKENYKYSGPKI